MFGYFTKVFGPIRSEVVETFELERAPNWNKLEGRLKRNMSLYGNFLPSKKIASPKGEVVDNGIDFTMNYMNMFFVIPSVTMREGDNNQVKVTYFYKAPWKWAHYYWMGFCTALFCGAALFLLVGVYVDVFKFPKSILEILIGALIAFGFPALMGMFFLFFGLYFRRDLMNKAKQTVADFIETLNRDFKP